MALVDLVEIQDYLHEGRRDYISDVRIRPSDETILIYVPREKIAPRVRSGFTSLRQLENLRKNLGQKYSVNIEIIQTASTSHQELESGVYQLLNRRFKDKIVSFFISFREESLLDSWIEVSDLDESLRREIEGYLRNLYDESSLSGGYFTWLSSSGELPTIPALLRLIKVNQPVHIASLLTLVRDDYPTVSKRWLSRKLDLLRRKNLLVWQKLDSYALTSAGIAVVPTGKSRSSSDVYRALALGRRKC